MNIVIAGAGAVGTHLATMLCRQEHNIMLIDTDEEKIESLESRLDINTLAASCTSIGALKDAGVGKCDLYIAVNPNEDQNINSTILAKKLGAKKTVARVNNSEYLEPENTEFLKSVGIDVLIYPERLAAEEIVGSMRQIGSRQLHEFSDGRLLLFGIKLWENALIVNKTLIQVNEEFGAENFRVVAVKRGTETLIPRGMDELRYGDLIFVVTKPSYASFVFKLCGKEQHDIKNIVIVGASRIGVKAASLLEKNYHVKIIEQDREKCIWLADKLKHSLIINGDGRDLNILREEGIKNIDAFISVTHSSETNILSCLLAKKMGVKKTVAEVENIDYIELAENIGIGTLVNTKLTAASYIYGYTMNVAVRHLKFLTFSEAEVFEMEAEEGSKITKHPLKDLRFPANATIGGITRNKEAIVATGELQIMPGDSVVVFLLPCVVDKVIKLFKR
ncbi:Trk system potassium transporter TrkA [Odoribacter sp. OttesenSCG-928-A06]|nr:Trk system potassium transporter TrkA [Odoribacter sp. OttesenSCG-928-A06]